MSTYLLIENNQQLNDYCQQLSHAKKITLDSEFVRTKTFYPHLGLLQVFDGQTLALIDPLNITDWQAFITTLTQTNIEKYLHACSEDLEVFQYQFKTVPTPIFDSQIMASFLDNPLSSGYAMLVNKYLHVELDKSETRTDWLKRPLTDKQCQYAANDVLYLLPLAEKLKALLIDKGWLNAACEECENAINRKLRTVDPEQAYLNVKNAWQLRSEQLAYLKKLACWRYRYAKQHDIALNFVIHEELLWKFSRYHPTSLAELAALGLRGKEVRLYGETIMSILSESVEPIPTISRVFSLPDYKKWAKDIKHAADQISNQTGLAPELLVAKRHIDQFVRWQHQQITQTPELLSGWRAHLFKSYLS